jgi:glutathione S-transferase
MMKLIASLTSPFARKVRIVLAEKQLAYELLWIFLGIAIQVYAI